MSKIHYVIDDRTPWLIRIACGVFSRVEVTNDPDKVTCVSCKRTQLFRERTGRGMPDKAEERSPRYVHLQRPDHEFAGGYPVACGLWLLSNRGFYVTSDPTEVSCPKCKASVYFEK